MDAIKIMATAIVGVMLVLMLKEQKPYIAVALVVMCTLYIFFVGLPYLDRVVSYIKTVQLTLDKSNSYMSTVVKITAISIVASLTASLCKDSGMSSVASVVMITSKAICMCMTLPVVAEFVQNILSVLP